MRAFAALVVLSFLVTAVPVASASLPWVCAFPPRAFACAGEYDWGDDAPGCGVTQAWGWVTTGTSATAWGMSCESGYHAYGAGGTAVNTTAVGFRWQTGECFTIFVVEYISFQWVEVPVCAVGEAPTGPWGRVGP